jgi:FkbM family methyltransferase
MKCNALNYSQTTMTFSNRHEHLFIKNLGRSAFFKTSLLWPLRQQLHKRTKRHISEKRKQLVVFSFDHIAHTINLDGVYEKDDLDTFFEWTKSLGIDFKEATALDVGANIGNHSLYFSDYFKCVVSFEPNHRAFKVLALNAELADNVVCHNLGLSDHVGEAVLSIESSNIGGSSITDSIPLGAQSIKLVDLDSFSTFTNVKLIKIDVEGHELKALTGAKKLIKEQMPIILFEQQVKDFTNGKSPVVSLLEEIGYEHFAILKKHPRIYGSGLNKFLWVPFLRMVFGEYNKIELVKKIEPDFYSFLIALPSWMKETGASKSIAPRMTLGRKAKYF